MVHQHVRQLLHGGRQPSKEGGSEAGEVGIRSSHPSKTAKGEAPGKRVLAARTRLTALQWRSARLVPDQSIVWQHCEEVVFVAVEVSSCGFR
jgi:hypothetical protein